LFVYRDGNVGWSAPFWLALHLARKMHVELVCLA